MLKLELCRFRNLICAVLGFNKFFVRLLNLDKNEFWSVMVPIKNLILEAFSGTEF